MYRSCHHPCLVLSRVALLFIGLWIAEVAVTSRADAACPQVCDGAELWGATAPAGTTAPATFLAPYTFVAAGNSVTAFESATGLPVWQQNLLSGNVIGSPVPSNLEGGLRAVFVTLDNGMVSRLNFANGNIDWTRDLRRPACPADRVAPTPAIQVRQLSNPVFQGSVFDDLVFVATNYTCAPQNQNRVHALQASTGNLQWVFNNPPAFPVGAATDGCTVDYARNRVYCGTNSSVPTQPSIWALSTVNGNQQWAVPAGPISVAPALGGLHLFAFNSSTNLIAIDPATGLDNWQLPFGNAVHFALKPSAQSPFVIHIADDGGQLSRVTDNGNSGVVTWSMNFGVGVTGPPSVTPDQTRIYIGLQDGRVGEVDGTTGTLLDDNAVGPPVPIYPSLDVDAGGAGVHELMSLNGSQVKRYCTPFFPDIMSRDEAIDLVVCNVIEPSPLESVMVGFLLKRIEPDSLFQAGTIVTDFDSTFTMNVANDSYLFWLDLDPEAFWTHPTQFVLVNARTGGLQIQDSYSWPVINGEQQNHLTFDGNNSPNRVHGTYASGTPTYTYTPVERPPTNSWAIIVTGMNLKKDGTPDAPAIGGDAARAKEILNGVEKGPKIPCANITTVNTGTGGDTGATNEEICAAFANLPKDCEKLWVYFVGHGSGEGSGHFVTRGANGKPGKLPWSEVRKKILETKAKEVCIVLMCCFSGDAIDDLEAALQEGGTGPKIRIKGSVITSSSASQPTDREADGSTWMKALVACWKDCNADLDDNMKITPFEAQAWARANSTKVAGRDPKGKTLGGDTVTFPPSHTTTETSSADGGGSIKYEMTFVYYKVGNTLTCRATLYINNTSGSPHTAQKSVKIICKDGNGKTIGTPIVLTAQQLSLGAKQRRCIQKLPAGCKSIKVEKVNAIREGEASPLTSGGVDSRAVVLYDAAPYRAGELVFETFQVIGEPGEIIDGSISPVAGWNTAVQPDCPFMVEAWLDTLDVIMTATVPDTATMGALIEVLMDNTSTEDSVCFQVNAMLFDSTGTPVSSGQVHRRKHIEGYGGVSVSGGSAELHDSILEISGAPACLVEETGRLVMTNTTVLADSGIAYTFEVLGDLDWTNSTLVEPATGLRLESASARIRDGGIVSSAGVGLFLAGTQDSLDFDFFAVSGSGGDGVVLDGAVNALLRNLSVDDSGGEDVVLRNNSSAELRDSHFDSEKLIVETGSSMTRSWSTNFVVSSADGDSLPGLTLTVCDSEGDTVAVVLTDGFGFSPTLALIQETWSGALSSSRTPHTIKLAVGSVDTTLVYAAGADSTVEIQLQVPSSDVPGYTPPPTLGLAQNRPNPFRNRTVIDYSLGDRCPITLELFDMNGRRIRTLLDRVMSKGKHQYVLDASDLPAGVYFYRVQAGKVVGTEKLVIVE